jgi:hypothetical protein
MDGGIGTGRRRGGGLQGERRDRLARVGGGTGRVPEGEVRDGFGDLPQTVAEQDEVLPGRARVLHGEDLPDVGPLSGRPGAGHQVRDRRSSWFN